MKEIIQFKKQRDLGNILADTFKFVRLNGLDLLKYIVRICGIPLIVVVVSASLYVNSIFSGLGSFFPNENTNIFSTNFIITLFIMLMAAVVFYTLLYSTVLHFIKSYIQNDGQIVETDIYTGVKNSFGRVFWLSMALSGILFVVFFLLAFITAVVFSLLNEILVVLGVLMAFIPAIYLAIVFVNAYPVSIFENKSIGGTISKCFKLIKDEWWITFATLLVMYLLYYMIAMIFQIPLYFYYFIKMFTSLQEISSDPFMETDWIYLILNAVGLIAQYMLFAIIIIVAAFIYYNLNEKKNFTGTLEAIEKIGYRKE